MDQRNFYQILADEFAKNFKESLFEKMPKSTTIKHVEEIVSDAMLAFIRAQYSIIEKIDGRTVEFKK
jgi:hypothetical protein